MSTIRLTEQELRDIIREEMMRGLPDFVLREATGEFIERLRGHLKRFVTSQPGNSTPQARREAYAAANRTLEELETEVHELLQEKLFTFLQTV
jgi:hypothetical protein